MIPGKYYFLTFSFFMSLLMSGVMSGVMSFTLLTLESTSMHEVMVNWPAAWTISMLVAFPVSMMVVPITQRLVASIVATS